MDHLEQIGKKIRALRLKAGYTNHETFAYDHNLQRKTVSRAETGKNITISTLLEILKALKITPEEFFKGIK